MSCIFTDKPKECYIHCMDSLKLMCLLNHIHLKVTEGGRQNLITILEDECDTTRRYKTRSGQVGRPQD